MPDQVVVPDRVVNVVVKHLQLRNGASTSSTRPFSTLPLERADTSSEAAVALMMWMVSAFFFSLTFWRSDFLTFWRSDILTFWRSDILTFWRSGVLAFWRFGGRDALYTEQRQQLPAAAQLQFVREH